MAATCDDCGRTVPPEEVKEGPYAHGSGRWTCLACIVEQFLRVELWWPELKDTEPVGLNDILHRLGLDT